LFDSVVTERRISIEDLPAKAWTVAYMFSRQLPIVKAIDEISFLAPVEVGSICTFNTTVVYTSADYIQVEVRVDVVDPPTGRKTTTNTFHVTLEAPGIKENGIMPVLYEDAMKFIEGRRRFNFAKDLWQ